MGTKITFVAYRVILWTIALSAVLALIVPLFVWAFAHRWHFPALVPLEYRARAWIAIFDPTKNIGDAILNSLGVALVVTALNVVLGIPIARALRALRAGWVVDIVIIFPLLIPPLTVLFALYTPLALFGVLNTTGAVVIAHTVLTIPYMLMILRGVFARIDSRFEEVAATLGASPLVVSWGVLFPLVAPALLVGALFVFLISWSQYPSTLLLGGGRLVTLPILLVSYAAGGDIALMFMVTCIQVLPALLFLLASSYFISGRGYGFAESLFSWRP